MERRAQDITKDELQLFLKGRWDTSDRENALEDWDTKTDGPLPKTPPEYEDHSIDGRLLPDPDDADGRRRHIRFADDNADDLDEHIAAAPLQKDQEGTPLLPAQPLEGGDDNEVEHQQVDQQGEQQGNQEVEQEVNQ
jgi:hypothetical protein